MRSKKLSPRKATTEKKLLLLNSDNHDTPNYWIQIGEKTVSITEQANGSAQTQKLWDIPKRDFNRLIDWYNKEQSIE